MKLVNNILSLAFVGFGIYLFFERIDHTAISDKLLLLSPILIVLAPYLLKKLFKIEIGEGIRFIYLVFVFLALFLGSIFGFYNLVPGFDKFVHFLSGILSAMIAVIILKRIDVIKKDSIMFKIIFIIFFAIFIAAMWEFYEFGCDKIFQRDAQMVGKTGVDDTMLDMISATLASILYSIYYYFSEKGKAK